MSKQVNTLKHAFSSLCAERVPAGSACVMNECDAASYCPFWEAEPRSCIARHENGEACTIDSNCVSGFCSRICADRPSGHACLLSTEP